MCMYTDDKKDHQAQPCLKNVFIVEGPACWSLYTSCQQTQAKKYMYSKIPVLFMSSNLDILIIRLFRRVVPRMEVWIFTRKRLHQGNRQISGTCSKRPPGVSVYQLLWCLLTHFLLLHQLLQLWRLKKYRGGPWWRRYPNGIFLWLIAQHKYRSRNKKLCVKT